MTGQLLLSAFWKKEVQFPIVSTVVTVSYTKVVGFAGGDAETVKDDEQSLIYVISKLSKVIVYMPLVQDTHTLSVQPT